MRNLTDVVDAIRKLAEQYPNAIYFAPGKEEVEFLVDSDPYSDSECMYSLGEVVDGPETPGCIVGQAVASLIGFDKVRDVDDPNMGAEDFLVTLGYNRFDRKNMYWIEEVQGLQDTCKTWSDAVMEADRRVKLSPS